MPGCIKRCKMTEYVPEIAIDLDGTLAHYDKFISEDHIGEPIEPMMKFVKTLIADGHKVVIFTARASTVTGVAAVCKWIREQGLPPLEVTNIKKKTFQTIYDDRAIQIIRNTGELYGYNRASKRQVGGNHYKKYAIQPAEYCHKNNIGSLESSVIKYVTRHKDKNGKVDIEKAIHCLEMILEWEYSE